MNRPRVWIALVVVSALLFCAVTVATAQALSAKGRPTATAVLDAEKVLQSLNEFQQFTADLNSIREKYTADKSDREKELANLQEELKIMNASQPGYPAKQEALNQKAFEYQSWGQWQQNKILRDSNLRILSLYRKISEASGEYAKANGYDIVVVKEVDIAQLTRLKAEEMQAGLAGRKLLYYAPELEITDPVITAMNNAYKNLKH